MVLKDVSSDVAPYWVQFHGLPLEAFTNANTKILGDSVRTAMMFEKPSVDGRFDRSFIRVRSLINLECPLVSGFWIPRLGKDPAWVSVKYERLQTFCYQCGWINHDGRRCMESLAPKQGVDAVKEYGSWLTTSAVRTAEDALEVCVVEWCEAPFIDRSSSSFSRRSWAPSSLEKPVDSDFREVGPILWFMLVADVS